MNQLEGRTKVFYDSAASAGAEIVNIPLRPPGGELWHLLWAEGEQNDGNVNCGWKWVDPENPAGIQLFGLAVAVNTPLAFGGMTASLQGPGAAPVPITDTRYPMYFFTASGAAKTGVVVAVIVEQIGAEGVDS